MLFDNGAISVEDDLSLTGTENDSLTVHKDHHIDRQHLAYYREHLAVVAAEGGPST